MTASSGEDDDARKHYCDAWAKSWRKLQEEQLSNYMNCMQRCLREQTEALQAEMDKSFEKQVLHVQRFFDVSSDLNVQISDVPAAHEKPHEYATAQDKKVVQNVRRHVTDPLEESLRMDSRQNAGDPLSLVKAPYISRKKTDRSIAKAILNSFRTTVGWRKLDEGDDDNTSQAFLKQLRTQGSITSLITPDDKIQRFALMIESSFLFDSLSGLILVLNTLTIATEADHALRESLRVGTYDTVFPKWVDIVFASCFCLELLIRVLAERAHFFHSFNLTWNVFDVVVVGSAIVELIFQTINFSFMRILRVFRMLKVVRIIRVFGAFRPLRLMISSILTSFTTLVWSLVLLGLFVFLFAIILAQGISDYVVDSKTIPDGIRRQLDEHFPSLTSGAYTLMTTISSGQDWILIARMFDDIDYFYFFVFTFYQCFIIFGLLNVLTGVFVESATHISKVDHELVLQAEMDRNNSFLNQIEELFIELDKDKNGSIEWEEFEGHLEDPRVHAYFAELQMDVTEAKGLFQLLDTSNAGSIAIEEFVLGCMRLKGMAKTIDVATMLYETKKAAQKMEDLRANVALVDVHVHQNTEAIRANTWQLLESAEAIRKNTSHISDLDDKVFDRVEASQKSVVHAAVSHALLSQPAQPAVVQAVSNETPAVNPAVSPVERPITAMKGSPEQPGSSLNSARQPPKQKATLQNFQSFMSERLVEHVVEHDV